VTEPTKKNRFLTITCLPCNKYVELPIEAATLTFIKQTDWKKFGLNIVETGTINIEQFIAYPHIICKSCLGAADIKVIEK
jgi:hypothetical protein